MRTLTAGELTRMRADAEATMFDVCEIGTFQATDTDGPEPNQGDWTFGETVPCGFGVNTTRESAGNQIPTASGEIRLPFGTTLSGADILKLLSRHGEWLETPELYRIVGEPRVGTVAVVVKVELILGGIAE